MNMTNNGFLIAAPQSGSGKTTVALALMAAFSRRGKTVAPFKCGPDFIDPGYHRLVTGQPSINLDGWMCPAGFVRDTFLRHAAHADLAVIEGVMGLFDGLGASADVGSSAQVATLTGAPVVLVVNARGMAASAAALVKGFAGFDPMVRLAGVIFNNVGSESHGELLRLVIRKALPEVAVFGCIPRDETLAIPSRHLGLVTAGDNPLPAEFVDRLADLAETHLDLDALVGLELADPAVISGDPSRKDATSRQCERPEKAARVRIAVARDAAFCFCYDDNLRLLREAGAETVFFSPLDDCRLPPGIAGIYLPGGYPELHVERLSANHAMRRAILAAIEDDMPVYAECGGLIYLTAGLEDTGDFVGVYPVRARMLPQRKALGYRQVETCADSIIGAAGTVARGHEFHYSEIGRIPGDIRRRYRVSRQGVEMDADGYCYRNCLASYIHLHFGSAPLIASSLVAACRTFASSQEPHATT
jgi:cobyrinic acid a,c-diamide synthase